MEGPREWYGQSYAQRAHSVTKTRKPPPRQGLSVDPVFRRDDEGRMSGDGGLRGGALLDQERRGRLDRVDAHSLPVLVLVLELHDPVDEGVDRVVAAEPDVTAGVEHRADLADDDVACDHFLAAELLDPPVLRIGVAPVLGGADSLLVCH